MAKLLVDGGADVNVRDDNGVAPLAVATGCGHMDVLRVLLDHPDIDVDTQVFTYLLYNVAERGGRIVTCAFKDTFNVQSEI